MTLVKIIPKTVRVRGKIFKLIESVRFFELSDAHKYTKLPGFKVEPKYGKYFLVIRKYSLQKGFPHYRVYERYEPSKFAKTRARKFLKEARN